MKGIGIIGGTVLEEESFSNGEQKTVETEFGRTTVIIFDDFVYVPRHGTDPDHFILPHAVNHPANMKVLKKLGTQNVIGINSTGSLRKTLPPGAIVIPDDFILPYPVPTTFHNVQTHITPTLNETIRQDLMTAASRCGMDVTSGGVYWQTPGPRLETRAEIRMMAQFADIVGMTMGGEAVAALELGLSYASICSVDNYAHGLKVLPLSMQEIKDGAHRNAHRMLRIIKTYIKMHKNQI